jgi:hypothetical protein
LGLIFWLRIGNFDEPMNARTGFTKQLEKTIGISNLRLDFEVVAWMGARLATESWLAGSG